MEAGASAPLVGSGLAAAEFDSVGAALLQARRRRAGSSAECRMRRGYPAAEEQAIMEPSKGMCGIAVEVCSECAAWAVSSDASQSPALRTRHRVVANIGVGDKSDCRKMWGDQDKSSVTHRVAIRYGECQLLPTGTGALIWQTPSEQKASCGGQPMQSITGPSHIP